MKAEQPRLQGDSVAVMEPTVRLLLHRRAVSQQRKTGVPSLCSCLPALVLLAHRLSSSLTGDEWDQTMSEVQGTLEFSVELHKFHNVDLFQRG